MPKRDCAVTALVLLRACEGVSVTSATWLKNFSSPMTYLASDVADPTLLRDGELTLPRLGRHAGRPKSRSMRAHPVWPVAAHGLSHS
jgi:hypothetical protein